MAKVASLVARPRTISTSAITGTGLKKCMPMTCAGRRVCAASLVMEMDEVLEARTAVAGRMRSRARKISDLRSKRSVAASTTKSAALRASRSTMGAMRARAGSISDSASLPLAASRPRLVRICEGRGRAGAARRRTAGRGNPHGRRHGRCRSPWCLRPLRQRIEFRPLEAPLECKREFNRPEALVAVGGFGGEVEAVGELEDERRPRFERGLGMADEQVDGDCAGADEASG